MLHHGHARVLGDEADERLAAARDGEIDVLALLHERAHGVAIGERDDLHGVARQPGALERRARRPSASAAFERAASEPPRRTTALPALSVSALASTVTLGRAS